MNEIGHGNFLCRRILMRDVPSGAWRAGAWRWCTCFCSATVGGECSFHATDREIETALSVLHCDLPDKYARVAVYGHRESPSLARVLSVSIFGRDGFPEVDQFVAEPLIGLTQFLAVSQLSSGDYDLWETIQTTGRPPNPSST